MGCGRSERCWLSLCVALAAQLCCCPSAVQAEQTPQQRKQLVVPRVSCSARRIRALFAPVVRNNIHVRDLSGATVPVPQVEDLCGVMSTREKNQSISFSSRYDSCYAHIESGRVVVPLHVQLKGDDEWFRVNISCALIKRRGGPTPPDQTLLPGKCGTDRALRVHCSQQPISKVTCFKLGCCYDVSDSTCYHRLNACSQDGHFVFSVKATDVDPPITPGNLIVKDQPQCFPVVATADTAVFKIGVKDCGAKTKVDGDVVIYEVEVEELHADPAEHSPFSLQVQCEYVRSDLNVAAVRSLFPVTNPPPVVALGTIRVLMRIAKDASFTSFFHEEQLPLALPLRETAFVEVSIAQPPPDPTLSLRVQDCFAYPASRHSVWTLLYDGCPNPLDDMKSSVPVDQWGRTASHSQVRRFDVKTFAFMDPHTGHHSVEEIYFYCWVEICTEEVDCAQSCAIVSSEGKRQRRETRLDQLQLVSLGPLLMGQNNTEVEDSPCVRQNTMFQVMVYMASGVGAALLVILLFTAWWNVTKCRKRKTQKPCESQVDGEQCQ